MTTPNSLITPQNMTRALVQYIGGVDAPGVVKPFNMPAAPSGSRFYSFLGTNNDTAAHTVTIGHNVGGSMVILTTANIPAGAGFNPGSPPVNLMWPGLAIDEYGNPYFQVMPGDSIAAYYGSTFATGAVVSLLATGWSY